MFKYIYCNLLESESNNCGILDPSLTQYGNLCCGPRRGKWDEETWPVQVTEEVSRPSREQKSRPLDSPSDRSLPLTEEKAGLGKKLLTCTLRWPRGRISIPRTKLLPQSCHHPTSIAVLFLSAELQLMAPQWLAGAWIPGLGVNSAEGLQWVTAGTVGGPKSLLREGKLRLETLM